MTAEPLVVSIETELVDDIDLRTERHLAGVLLPDLAIATGLSIPYLLKAEGGHKVAPWIRDRISAAISEMVREKLDS